ncbi:MAG: c-type cytochrome [Stellaceae bacterium]
MTRAAGTTRSALLAALLLIAAAPLAQADDEAVKRGAYLFATADCAGCHTDAKNNGKPLAGGRALATPFGTFYGPNITPDPKFGIGEWTEAQFHRALREGIAPGRTHLFPVFPFPSFTGLTDADIADLYAFLKTQEPVPQPNKPHDVTPPFGFRFGLVFWRLLFFDEGPWRPDPAHDAVWNRGSYLANAVVHCGECHTPRNFLGAMKTSQTFAGNPKGPDGQRAPNITPDPEKGIGKWSYEDIETVLKTGQLPYFDQVGSGMAEVVKGTSQLTDEDRHAIAVYLKTLKAVPGS